MKKPALLILADGTVFRGRSFGAPPLETESLSEGKVSAVGAGEVVFNTGMTGYQEILTDPSYVGQMVAMTYPLIGNYGVLDEWNEGGPERELGRKKVKVAGFIIRDLYEGPVPAGRICLSEFLEREGIPGITGVDTRKLTLRLRDEGTPAGIIVGIPKGCGDFTDSQVEKVLSYLAVFPSMEGRNLVGEVGTRKAETVQADGKCHVVLLDCGTKAGILRELSALGARVSVLPSSVSHGEVMNLKPDGVLFSNGPGDPAVLDNQIRLAARLIGKVPVFGVCLGHQIIALALGAKTYKLRFGHHGANNPVLDLRDGRAFVTSQNHGFAVEEGTLPADAKVWFKNANDGTVEGLYHASKPVMCVQFHPEASPGPKDTRWIFAEFLKRIAAA